MGRPSCHCFKYQRDNLSVTKGTLLHAVTGEEYLSRGQKQQTPEEEKTAALKCVVIRMWWKVKYLCLQVVVQHVNIQGLGRTKEDLLGYEISDVFHAKNLIDVCIADCAGQRGVVVIVRWLLSSISVSVTGDEKGSHRQTEAAPPGNLQRRGGSHRYVRR